MQSLLRFLAMLIAFYHGGISVYILVNLLPVLGVELPIYSRIFLGWVALVSIGWYLYDRSCPMTKIENYLRKKVGMEIISHTFIVFYLQKILRVELTKKGTKIVDWGSIIIVLVALSGWFWDVKLMWNWLQSLP